MIYQLIICAMLTASNELPVYEIQFCETVENRKLVEARLPNGQTSKVLIINGFSPEIQVREDGVWVLNYNRKLRYGGSPINYRYLDRPLLKSCDPQPVAVGESLPAPEPPLVEVPRQPVVKKQPTPSPKLDRSPLPAGTNLDRLLKKPSEIQ